MTAEWAWRVAFPAESHTKEQLLEKGHLRGGQGPDRSLPSQPPKVPDSSAVHPSVPGPSSSMSETTDLFLRAYPRAYEDFDIFS